MYAGLRWAFLEVYWLLYTLVTVAVLIIPAVYDNFHPKICLHQCYLKMKEFP